MATTQRRLTIAAAAVGLVAGIAAIAWFQLRARFWSEQPGYAFAQITGRELPVRVFPVTYRSAIGDNFFHKTHFWLLEGETGLLRQVLVGTGFERSDEDAKSVVPSAGAALEISLSSDDVVEGYEWDRGRDSWYLLLKGGKRAIYVQ